MGRRHAQVLGRIDVVQVVAVCDVDRERARALGEELGVPWFSDSAEMVEAVDLDVVEILTPPDTHGSIALRLLDLKPVHLVVEKPLALSLDEAMSMVKAAREKGVYLVTVYQNRANEAVKRLREVLESGGAGVPVLGSFNLYWCRYQDYYRQYPWRGKWACEGGVLANQGAHFVDMLCWLLGDVEEVFALCGRRLIDMEAEDTLVASVRFSSGALGSMQATVCARPRNIEGSVTLLFERGAVKLGGKAMERVEFSTLDGVPAGLSNPEEPFYSHWSYLTEVYRVIAGLEEPSCVALYEEGLRSLEVIHGAYESCELGRPVNLPFTPVASKLGRS